MSRTSSSIVALFVVIAAAVVVFVLWQRRHSPIEEAKQVEHVRESFPVAWLKKLSLTLPGSVQSVKSSVQADGVTLPVILVKDVASALDLDSPSAAGAFNSLIKFSRDNGKLHCLIWSGRGRRALAVAMAGVSGSPQPSDQIHGDTPGGMPLEGVLKA